MENMYIGFTKELKNALFYDLFDILDSWLDSENIKSDLMKEASKRIKKHHKRLVLLKIIKPRHHLTAVINEKVLTRTQYLKCLRMMVDANLLMNLPEKREAAKLLKFWVENQQKDLYIPSIHVQSNLTGSFLQDREKRAEIKKATTLLDLDDLLEDIEKLTTEITNDYRLRLKEITHQSVKGKELRDAAYKDLKFLINTLEVTYSVAKDEEEREELRRLNFAINDHLKTFRTLLKSRKTKRKNKKRVAAAVKELISSPLENKPDEQEEKNLPMKMPDNLKPSEGVDNSGDKDPHET